MDSSLQQAMALLARGGVPALACLCCSFCTADPDVVFWTLASGDGTPRDGGGVAGADGAAGEVTLDAEIRQQEGGTSPDSGRGYANPLCADGGLEKLTDYFFPEGKCERPLPVLPDGETYDFEQVGLSPYDGGSPGLFDFELVAGIEQCRDKGNAWYPDDIERPSKIIACPGTCEGIKSGFDFGISILCGVL